MIYTGPGIQEDVLQMQKQAEERVRQMREENERIARHQPPDPPAPPPENDDRLLPLLLAAVLYREGAPLELVLALLYVAL